MIARNDLYAALLTPDELADVNPPGSETAAQNAPRTAWVRVLVPRGFAVHLDGEIARVTATAKAGLARYSFRLQDTANGWRAVNAEPDAWMFGGDGSAIPTQGIKSHARKLARAALMRARGLA